MGITCTSILAVSVFGAAAADPHRRHLPVQVTTDSPSLWVLLLAGVQLTVSDRQQVYPTLTFDLVCVSLFAESTSSMHAVSTASGILWSRKGKGADLVNWHI